MHGHARAIDRGMHPAHQPETPVGVEIAGVAHAMPYGAALVAHLVLEERPGIVHVVAADVWAGDGELADHATVLRHVAQLPDGSFGHWKQLDGDVSHRPPHAISRARTKVEPFVDVDAGHRLCLARPVRDDDLDVRPDLTP